MVTTRLTWLSLQQNRVIREAGYLKCGVRCDLEDEGTGVDYALQCLL